MPAGPVARFAYQALMAGKVVAIPGFRNKLGLQIQRVSTRRLTRAVAGAVHVPVIASGGANSAEHVREAFAAGADAVLAASIFHDGDTTPNDVKLYLQEHGIRVRP